MSSTKHTAATQALAEHLVAQQDALFETISGLLAPLSSSARLKLIHFLSQSPLTVEILAQKIKQSVANTSMHLRKMQQAGWVTSKRLGQRRQYQLHPSALVFWEQALDFCQALSPHVVLRGSPHPSDLTWNRPLAETVQLIQRKKAYLVDVRPEDESHTSQPLSPWIHHIPHDLLTHELAKLPRSLPILLLCRGRLCGLSVLACTTLRNKGLRAYRLEIAWHQLVSALTPPRKDKVKSS